VFTLYKAPAMWVAMVLMLFVCRRTVIVCSVC